MYSFKEEEKKKKRNRSGYFPITKYLQFHYFNIPEILTIDLSFSISFFTRIFLFKHNKTHLRTNKSISPEKRGNKSLSLFGLIFHRLRDANQLVFPALRQSVITNTVSSSSETNKSRDEKNRCSKDAQRHEGKTLILGKRREEGRDV